MRSKLVKKAGYSILRKTKGVGIKWPLVAGTRPPSNTSKYANLHFWERQCSFNNWHGYEHDTWNTVRDEKYLLGKIEEIVILPGGILCKEAYDVSIIDALLLFDLESSDHY